MTLRALTTVVFLTALSAHAYEMADLEALQKQSAWEELVGHLGDIAPSKRDAKWLAIAEQASAEYLKAIDIDENSAQGAFYTSDDLVKRYPALKQSKRFLAARAEVGLKAFGFTYSNYRHSRGDDEWLVQIKKWVQADATTTDLPVRAAKKVQSRLMASVAWPLWKMAVDRGNTVCADKEFQEAIIMAVGEKSWPDETKPVVEKCWAELKAPVLKQVAASKDLNEVEAICALLKTKSVESPACKQ